MYMFNFWCEYSWKCTKGIFDRSTLVAIFCGLTENAGHENDRLSKSQGMKIAVHANEGHENEGPTSRA